MQRTILGLIAATALTSAIPAIASAKSINERQDNLFQRIEAGVRARQLTQNEANALRNEFQDLARLENTYRTSGGRLTDYERDDLNRRFDSLSARIRIDRADSDRGPGDRGSNWQPINQRQDALFERIDRGVRSGGLTRVEAERLRGEFQGIVRLEERYRRDGLDRNERADLDNRLDRLAQQIRMERRDGQQAGRFDIGQRLASLSNAIERAAQRGWVSGREARDLRYGHREVANLDARYSNGGYSPAERNDLNNRLATLEQRLQAETGRDVSALGGGYNR